MKGFNPFFSVVQFLNFRRRGEVRFPEMPVGEVKDFPGWGRFRVFKSISMGRGEVFGPGDAIFQVMFHAPRLGRERVIRKTDYTLPFFSGLPGFRWKLFLIDCDEAQSRFSGYYCWATVEQARAYSRSFACRTMARRSRPFPLEFRITEQATGRVIEEGRL